MRSWITRVAVGASCAALTACSGGQTGDESTGRLDAGRTEDAGTDAGGGDFFDSIRQSFGNYDAARSVAELAERSEVVALGRIAAVRPGRVRRERDDVGPNTAVMEFAVSEVLKGEPAERLYVELYVGLVFEAARLPDPLPDNRVLVFLIPTMPIDAGVPDGEVLYTATTPQGIVVETESGAPDADDLFNGTGSFDAVLDSLRDEQDAGQ